MLLFIILSFILILLNLFTIRILFSNRLIGKILFGLQVISFITMQVFFWRFIRDEFINYHSTEGLIAFIVVVISYLLIIYFLLKRTVINRILKKFIKNYIPTSDIKNKDLLSKFNYIYYHKRNNEGIRKSRIVYSNIYDVRKKDGYEEYLVVFYILEKVAKKKKLFIEKVIFKKKLFEHLDKCPNCGNNVKTNNIYCDYCSTKLVDEDNIIEVEAIDVVESMSMGQVISRANNNNLFLHMFFINIFLIAFILLMSYILEGLKLEGFPFILVYIVLILLPNILISFSLELPLFPLANDNSQLFFVMVTFVATMMMIFDLAMTTITVARFIVTTAIAIKAFVLLYHYFKCKK